LFIVLFSQKEKKMKNEFFFFFETYTDLDLEKKN